MTPEQRLNVLKALHHRAVQDRDTKAAAALADVIDWATSDAFTEGAMRRTSSAILKVNRVPLRRGRRGGQLEQHELDSEEADDAADE